MVISKATVVMENWNIPLTPRVKLGYSGENDVCLFEVITEPQEGFTYYLELEPLIEEANNILLTPDYVNGSVYVELTTEMLGSGGIKKAQIVAYIGTEDAPIKKSNIFEVEVDASINATKSVESHYQTALSQWAQILASFNPQEVLAKLQEVEAEVNTAEEGITYITNLACRLYKYNSPTPATDPALYPEIREGDLTIASGTMYYAKTVTGSAITWEAIATNESVDKKNAEIIKTTETTISRVEWRNGTCANINNPNGISMVDIQPNKYATSVSLLINVPLQSGYKYRYQLTTYSVNTGHPQNNQNKRITIEKTILSNSNFITFDLLDGSIGYCLSFTIRDENDVVVPIRIDSFDTNQIYAIKNYDEKALIKDYYLNAGMVKQKIKLDLLGSVSGVQSFCRYNNHYYSTNGSYLYEQDENFNKVSQWSVALNLGHGNSLQLGNNGKAYASGWDDNNIYVVDLATKTIDSVIALPTTGYTTCAIDDINQIAYIFQRDSRPNTNENYNFIVYDYTNQNIISTKKTNKSFGAMQACDFIDGKIYVLNGLGTSQIPNSFCVYSTSGDILGEFILDNFSNIEPEGVFIDRTSKEILISFADNNVYKLITL